MKTQLKRIAAEDKASEVVLQWGAERVAIATMDDQDVPQAVMFDLEGVDELLEALHEARRVLAKGRGMKQKRATLYARVPHSLKLEFLVKAQEEGLTQNAAIIAAVEGFLDPLVEYRP